MATVEVICRQCAKEKHRIGRYQQPGLVSRVCLDDRGVFATVGLRERVVAKAIGAEHHAVYKEGHKPRIRLVGQALLP